MAIDECHASSDFEAAKALLDLTHKLYRFPAGSSHRVYVNSAMRLHKLWENKNFWEFAFTEEMRFFVPSLVATEGDESQQGNTFCFNLTGNYIFMMLSMGVEVGLTRTFVMQVPPVSTRELIHIHPSSRLSQSY
jgi:hypothetical protein